MRDVRTVVTRTKDRQGRTVKSFVEAPLCDTCRGLGLVPDKSSSGVMIDCPECNGKGEHRAQDTAYPQINDEYQAAI